MSVKAAVGLVLIALCAVGNDWLLQAQVETQASDAAVINVSGRQRMLSQRLAAQLLQISVASSPEELAEARAAMMATMTEMGQATRSLTQGDEARGLFFKPSEELQALYWGQGTGLAPRVDALMGQAAMYSFRSADPEDEKFQDLIAEIQGPILEDLDRAVAIYERESVARVAHLSELQNQLTWLLLVLLLVEFGLIFHPMARSVGQEMAKVLAARHEAESQRASLARVMDSTSEALVPIDAQGRVMKGSSAQAIRLFPALSVGHPYWTAFSDDEALSGQLSLDFEQIQDGLLPWELLVDQMHSQLLWHGHHLRLRLQAIEEDGVLQGYLLSFRDMTAEIQAQQASTQAEQRVQVLLQYARDPRRFARSVDELRGLMQELLDPQTPRLDGLRALHTLKGTSAVLGFLCLSRSCQALEQRIQEEPELDWTAPVLQMRARWASGVERLLPDLSQASVPVSERALRTLIGQAREQAPELADALASWLGVPVKGHLEELAAHARDLAGRLDKRLKVEVECPPDLYIPEGSSGELWGQLVHLVRNAVDHGVESPAHRVEQGKAPEGTLRLSAAVHDQVLVLKVQDDGAGVDWERLRARALAQGLHLRSPEELLFANGLSSRDHATEISGRGLGVGSLRECVREAGGTVRVLSTRMQGTSFVVHWPLQSPALSMAS